MCKWGTYRRVRVKLADDLSCTGKSRWRWIEIDKCIALLVEALQKAGIDMRHSCCGHGKGPGDIILQDGRVLIITDNDSYKYWKDGLEVKHEDNNHR